eukprot:TRINITY_DN916_c0_g1_i3.p1 TRINITY_DN916_c0_g1~~TRINITY_DN916_c0_g1_i3.p1  ORF type:complete len:330 (-),score=55.58 TRINITY_DN916_c0_g1_i3:142-1131(-)
MSTSERYARCDFAAMHIPHDNSLQVFDEMCDNGFPFTTEPNILKQMMHSDSMFDRVIDALTGKGQVATELPGGAISPIEWRATGIKYTNNEIYLDIVESLDCIVDSSSQVVSERIVGEILANCRLSGMPDLQLVFVDPSVLDECSFHPCVRYARYERDRVISFVPPDGKFKLMSYRSSRNADLPIYVRPQFSWYSDGGKLTVMCGTRSSSLKSPNVEEVTVTIPFPKSVQSVSLSANVGAVQYDEITKTCRWVIGTIPKQVTPQLNGSVVLLPHEQAPESNPSLGCSFKMNMFSFSGLKVGSLTLVNERYKPGKFVRAISKSGNIEIRA